MNRFQIISSHLIKPSVSTCLCLIVLSVSLFTEANISLAVSQGYISGLLDIYEKWHSKNTHRAAIGMCSALLHCFHKVSRTSAGRQAFVSLGGLHLLYKTSQVNRTSTGRPQLAASLHRHVVFALVDTLCPGTTDCVKVPVTPGSLLLKDENREYILV